MSSKWLMLGVVLLLVTLLPGCTVGSLTGSGNIVTRQESITGFDKVNVSHGFTADILQGESYSVVIRMDDNLEKYLEVAKRGSTLNIGLKRNRPSTLRNVTLEATVTMPELTGLELSGGSHGTITGFKSNKALGTDVSGGSHLRGDIEAGDARFDFSGGSHATLTGSAGDLTINASGGSQVDLSAFAVTDANVEASGGSQATVNASGRLDVEATGGSKVFYLGSPTLGKVESSGGAEIRRK